MRIMLFHGEQSIADLADNIYACLSPKSHAVAEAALLEANPQLKAVGRLKPGAILKVPMISGISFKADQSHVDTADQLGEALIRSLKSYYSHLKDAVEEEENKLGEEAKLLEDTEYKQQAKDDDELRALSAQAMHGLELRIERLKNCKNTISGVFDRLINDLKKFSR